jgi:hypothetical protein
MKGGGSEPFSDIQIAFAIDRVGRSISASAVGWVGATMMQGLTWQAAPVPPPSW